MSHGTLHGAVRFLPRKGTQSIDRALRVVIRTAFRDVPVYRRLWHDVGIVPTDFRESCDLIHFPTVSKMDLLADGLQSRVRRGTGLAQCVRRGTSGTAGPPMDILYGRAEFRFRQFALLQRVLKDMGRWRFVRPIRWVEAGAWIPPERRARPLQTGRFVSILRIPRSRSMAEQMDELRRFRPDIVSGCPSDLKLLAHELLEDGSTSIRPRLVICRGEVLHPAITRLLERAFQCRVTDYYNVQEVGNLAWRCPANPKIMHANTATAFLEIVDSDGAPCPPGVEGEVLVTNLTNRTMPFVRYRLSDVSAWIHSDFRRCTCGAYGPSLSPIQGRVDDLIRLPDGRLLSPRVIDDLVMETIHASIDDPLFTPEIRTYQIIQEAIDRLTVLVESPEPVSLVEDAISERLRAIHPALRLTFVVVDQISRGSTGKIRRVVSRLSDP